MMSAGSGSCVASFASQSSVSLNLRWFGLSAISQKMRVARLVELQAVERDREVVLRELLVAVVVARLAVDDAIERQRGFAPALAVEEALRLRGLLGHLSGDDRACLGRRAFVEIDVDAFLLLLRLLVAGLRFLCLLRLRRFLRLACLLACFFRSRLFFVEIDHFLRAHIARREGSSDERSSGDEEGGDQTLAKHGFPRSGRWFGGMRATTPSAARPGPWAPGCKKANENR